MNAGFSRIDLGEYLSRLVQLLSSSYRADSRRIAVRCTLPETIQYLDLGGQFPCGLIVNELVTNAFGNAFPRRATRHRQHHPCGARRWPDRSDGGRRRRRITPDLDLGATNPSGCSSFPCWWTRAAEP